MSKKNKFYLAAENELDDRAIINAIKEALNDYRQGAILECRDTLKSVVNAINKFDKEFTL